MLGVIADDLTGANDVGAMLHRAGLDVTVIRHTSEPVDITDSSALVVDTNSRCEPAAEAYRRVRQAAELLLQRGCDRFYKKLCSVFRGNIGAELDALVDVLQPGVVPVAVGFPENGRVTRCGLHYVHGRLLEESEFRHDPVHPMTESNLVEILQRQTHRRVAAVSWQTVAEGASACRREMKSCSKYASYVVFDVVRQEDLAVIASASRECRLAAGSSALAEYIGRQLELRGLRRDPVTPSPDAADVVLIIAGSTTPQTRAQIERAQAAGMVTVTLDSGLLLEAASAREEVERAARKAAAHLGAGVHTILHPSGRVLETVARGHELGLTQVEVGQAVARALGATAAAVMDSYPLQAMILCGGETADMVFHSLRITGNRVLKEVAPGVPSGITLGNHSLLTVIKAGGFGSEDFLLTAVAHLTSQMDRR